MSIITRPFAETYVGVPRKSVEVLSIEAVGLHAFILSLDTSATLADLKQRTKWGDSKLQLRVYELLTSGYIIRRGNAFYPTDSTIVKGGDNE